MLDKYTQGKIIDVLSMNEELDEGIRNKIMNYVMRADDLDEEPDNVFYSIYNTVNEYEMNKEKFLLNQADIYFRNAFKECLVELKKESRHFSPVELYIEGMGALLSQNNKSKEMQVFEQEIEKVISFIYPNHRCFTPGYTDEESIALKKVVMAFSLLFYKKSDKMRQLLCEQLMLDGTAYCENMLGWVYEGQGEEEMLRIIEEVDVPNLCKVTFYGHKILKTGIKDKGILYYDRLQTIYAEEPDAIVSAYEGARERKEPSLFLFFAFLRMKGRVSNPEEISEIETILKEFYRPVAEENKKVGYPKDIRAFQATLMLYEVSQVAKELLKEMLENKVSYDILWDAEIFSQYFYQEMKGNILEEMAKEIGVKVVMKYAIEWARFLSNNILIEFVKLHLEVADELMREKMQEEGSMILAYVKKLYTEDIGMKKETLANVFTHSSDVVLINMEKFAVDREQLLRTDLEKLYGTANKKVKNIILRIEKKWDKEKHKKHVVAAQTAKEAVEHIEAIYKAKSIETIPYVNESSFTSVKDNQGNELPSVLLNYYLSEYMRTKTIEPINSCEAIKKFMNERQLRLLINEMYERWLQEGADTKKKNVLILYALNAENTELTLLKKQIDEWAANSRGSLASFAVTAMAINGSSMALMLTDGIARKYKNSEVKRAAEWAMRTVPEVRGLSKETLADKIVPTLGFDEKREMIVSYGTRCFKVKLTSKLELSLFDEEKQKVIKALPKPGSQDNEEKALEAKKSFDGLKKQIKAVITTQQQRLAKAILTGRSWQLDDWKELFVKNPIMKGFAISLIWGEYNEEGKLLGTFRYMEDGSFNTIEEETYSFGEQTVIKLVHPMDLSEKEKLGWKQQLKDYEITQSVMQLDIPIYALTPEESNEPTFTKFKGEEAFYGKVLGVMDKYEWQKTEAIDGGCFVGFYDEDEASNVGMLLRLDGAYMGMPATETVKIVELIFYKKGAFQSKSYYSEEQMQPNMIWLKDVPSKILNRGLIIVYEISAEKDRNRIEIKF